MATNPNLPGALPATSAAAPDTAWHALEAEAVLSAVESRAEGLSDEEAERRLQQYGPNRLSQGRRSSNLLRFLLQFHNLLIYVLMAASGLAAIVGHLTDAVVVLVVILVNATIGFIQEGRAERALDAIHSLIDSQASVIRSGQRRSVNAIAVVPGDVVMLEAGDRVCADLRLLKAANLRIDESILTGESVAADKITAAVAAESSLGDRYSMAFSGSFIVAGQGVAVVVATGAGTQLGRISTLMTDVDRLTTPLVRQMDQLARQITVAVLATAALVCLYAIGVQGYAFDAALMVVVGLVVAAIPEGLPAVMTITLAVGVQRMARRKAIIRRLPAVETLGSVSVICSDKTGTLTSNQMTVSRVVTARHLIDVEGTGYRPQGGFRMEAQSVDPAADPVLEELSLAALLCNDSQLHNEGVDWIVEGDPMEGALVSLARKAGHESSVARAEFARLDEIPFDSRHRYMATLHRSPDSSPTAYVKGAPERLLEMCVDEAVPGGTQPIRAAYWQDQIERLASQGQRVLALGRRSMPPDRRKISIADVEQGLTLIGMVGLIDPPRAEAIAAVAECRTAGIRVKMITGDHIATARAIALQLSLADDPQAVTGEQLDTLDAAAFADRAQTATVFARTSPEHKLRLVESLQADGSIVAMTGDGVNDAPALKRADVGVAMGGKGTEAAKEASDMVLADDNFASIVHAVREGRTVYDNLGKVIGWTLPTNGGESLIIILAILFGLTLPVTPVQILWINMVTAVALGLTLAFESAEPGVMRRQPRRAQQGLISGRLAWRILFISILMVAGTFGIYTWARHRELDVETARTMVVNTMVVMEIFYLFSVRYVHGSALTWRGALGTRAVLIGVGLVILAQFAFTYLPPMHRIFDSRPVGLLEGFAIIGVGVLLLFVVEVEKWLARRLRGPAPT